MALKINFPITKPKFNEEEIKLIRECLDSGWVTQGPMVKKFETLFAERHQVKFALATTSCTAALHLAILSLDIQPGDEVIVPAFTWVTSAHCVEYAGARVVFADIDINTFNIDPESFEDAITERTRAVVVVHLFGLSANLDSIMEIARKYKLKIIEDSACAIGTTFRGRPVGSFGDIGCFSFHPRKIITTGEGGMVTTQSEFLSKMVMSLRNHGDTIFFKTSDKDPKPYEMDPFDFLGYNLRLSDIQAAVGISQMGKLERLLIERKRSAEFYLEILKDIEDIILPSTPLNCGHTYQSFVIRLVDGNKKRRNKIMEKFFKEGIQSRPGTHAVHRLGYYQNKYGIKKESFPNACLGEDTTITLPIYPGMTEIDQNFIEKILRKCF